MKLFVNCNNLKIESIRRFDSIYRSCDLWNNSCKIRVYRRKIFHVLQTAELRLLAESWKLQVISHQMPFGKVKVEYRKFYSKSRRLKTPTFIFEIKSRSFIVWLSNSGGDAFEGGSVIVRRVYPTWLLMAKLFPIKVTTHVSQLVF